MKPTAYTVGNPDVYEDFIDEHKEDAKKATGGVVFLTREEAEEVVADGFLPSRWFNGRTIPGRVYGLLIPDIPSYVKINEQSDGLWYELTKSATLVKL